MKEICKDSGINETGHFADNWAMTALINGGTAEELFRSGIELGAKAFCRQAKSTVDDFTILQV